jgi:hypothetical protein
MDVQGAELKVLIGAKDFIKKIKVIWLKLQTLNYTKILSLFKKGY